MRSAFPLLVAAAALGSGCQWMKNSTVEPKPQPYTGALPDRQAGDFVAYLNRQSSYLQTLSYDEVTATAFENGREVGSMNDSSVYCSRPRSFRLMGRHRLAGTMVDIGSNDNEFWMYAKPLGKDNYFYCSHEAFARGDVKLPFPFDTDWVMQALGMADYDPAGKYSVEPSRDRGAYILRHETRTRTGVPVVKATVFAADWENGRKPAVRRHVVFDARDPNKPIASADILAVKAVRTADGGMTQIPTEVALDWPQQGFKMTMTLGDETINEDPRSRLAKLFQRPRISGTNPIDLARYQVVVPSSYRGQIPDERKTFRLPQWTGKNRPTFDD